MDTKKICFIAVLFISSHWLYFWVYLIENYFKIKLFTNSISYKINKLNSNSFLYWRKKLPQTFIPILRYNYIINKKNYILFRAAYCYINVFYTYTYIIYTTICILIYNKTELNKLFSQCFQWLKMNLANILQ